MHEEMKDLQNLYDKIDELEQTYVNESELETWLKVGDFIKVWREFKLQSITE